MMTQDTQPETDFIENMCQRYPYWKIMRLTGWILRFKSNCQGRKARGPLVTDELNGAEKKWIKLIQHTSWERPKDVETILDKEEITLVNTRVPGYTPILLPQRGEFTRRIIEHFHLATLHGGVQSTMAKLREKFWIPKLRQLVRTVVHRCNTCKLWRVKRLHPPATSDLPSFRTEFTRPWAVVGVDYAGPIYYKLPAPTQEPLKKGQKIIWITEKIYILLFTCAITRAVHLGLCLGLSTQEFIYS